VLNRREHSFDAVVAAVVVGHSHEIEAGPGQFVGHFGVGAHPSAARPGCWGHFVVVQQHFQVCKRYVGAADHLYHLEISWLLVD